MNNTINRKALNKLADRIEALPEHQFNMGVWLRNFYTKEDGEVLSDQYTCGCIGGWAEVLFRKGYEKLGLSDNQRATLMYPNIPGRLATKEKAVSVLRKIADYPDEHGPPHEKISTMWKTS